MSNTSKTDQWKCILKEDYTTMNELLHLHAISILNKTSHTWCIMCDFTYMVQFSHSVKPDSLWPHGLQHMRLPCPSPTPGACSNSCPSSWWCHPTISSSSPPAFNLSQHRVFSNDSVLLIRWPKYWSFSISPSNEYSELIPFRMDGLDLAVQGTLKSILQHHSSKASTLWHSAFFMVHLSHPHMTTGKTIALTRQTFVGKVMSLLFNILSKCETTLFYHSPIFNFNLLLLESK